MLGKIKSHLWVILGCVLTVLIGLALIYLFLFKPKDKIQQKLKFTTTPISSLKLDNKINDKTTYEYTQKATKEDADVEVVSHTTPLIVSVNGVKHEVPTTTVEEEHKLENGKLVVQEEKQVVLDLKVPEQPHFKKGLYIEGDTEGRKTIGARASYQTKDFDVDLKADLKTYHGDNRVTLTATKWF